MEKLKEFYDENKKLVVGVGAASVALSFGALWIRSKTRPLKQYNYPSPLFFNWKYDKDFVKENISLYKVEAEKRSELISDVTYDLFLSLALRKEFNGKLTTQFYLKSKEFEEDDIFMDFQGRAMVHQINGKPSKGEFKGHRIYLPRDELKRGYNQVTIMFKNTYVQNSAGLHWFQDPADDNIYLFSHLEPFFCHRIFPCFDQPDLKAVLALSVHTPSKDWVAIGNASLKTKYDLESDEAQKYLTENNIKDILKARSGSLHLFNKSPLQSSYIYGFHFGDYHCFENTDPDAQVPMKCYVRKTVMKSADPEERFRVLKEGIKYYEDFFGYKFPFEKYDIIYCPEYRIGAMENVGAITFNERFLLPPSDRTSESITKHSYVGLHELSHMWFGDLVTMKWWNDLWLKESFADFMSSTCISSVPELSEHKNSECIFLNLKFNALYYDSRSCTHPILAPINHTEDATSVFDRISYDKGASFIRMMKNMFGEEIIRQTTKLYMNKYAWKNTYLDNFIDCLEQAYNKYHKGDKDIVDIRGWTDSWVKTQGLNIIEPQITYSQDNKTIESFKIVQSCEKNGDEIFRMQKIDIAFYYEDSEVSYPSILIQDKEVTEVEELKGKEKPSGYLLNSQHYGYCKIKLEESSIDYFVDNLRNIKSDLDRNVVYRYLWQNYKSNYIEFSKFFDVVKNNIVSEPSINAIFNVLSNLRTQLSFYMLPGDEKDKLNSEVYDLTVEIFSSRTEKHDQNLVAEFLLTFLPDPKLIIEYLSETADVLVKANYNLTTAQKRRLLVSAYANPSIDEKVKSKFYEELTEGKGYEEELLQIACDAAQEKNTEKWWNNFLDGTKMSKDKYVEAMESFYASNPFKIMEKYADRFYAEIDGIFLNKHRDYAEAFLDNLIPLKLGRQHDLENLQKIYESVDMDRSHFRKCLSIKIEDLEDIISKRN